MVPRRQGTLKGDMEAMVNLSGKPTGHGYYDGSGRDP